MNNGTTPYFCHDCKLKFTVYRMLSTRPYCPVCGDNVGVRRNPYRASINPETVGTKPRWTDEQEQMLINLYNNTPLTIRQISEQIGRSKKAVYHKVESLNLKEC